MRWKSSIWFFDVDDTLINTDELTATGAEGVKSVFENNCSLPGMKL